MYGVEINRILQQEVLLPTRIGSFDRDGCALDVL